MLKYVPLNSFPIEVFNFANQAFDELDRLLDRTIVKFVFMPFHLEYVKLNEAMIRGRKEQIERQFKRLLKLKLTEKQKQIVYVNGFNYYLSENDGKKVKQFYRLVNTLKEEEIIQSTRISYDIFHEKGYTYLDEVLENYKHCADEEKYVNEFLLSVMYKNKGDHEKAAYYEELSKKHAA